MGHIFLDMSRLPNISLAGNNRAYTEKNFRKMPHSDNSSANEAQIKPTVCDLRMQR